MLWKPEDQRFIGGRRGHTCMNEIIGGLSTDLLSKAVLFVAGLSTSLVPRLSTWDELWISEENFHTASDKIWGLERLRKETTFLLYN